MLVVRFAQLKGFFSGVVLAAGIVAGTLPAQAAVVAYYPLGDGQTNGATAAIPADSTGNHNFKPGQVQNASKITVDTTNFAPVADNTASYFFVPNSGFYGVEDVNNEYPLTDNFRVDLWARASDVAQGNNQLLSADGSGLNLSVTNGNYTAAIGNTVFSTGPALTTDWAKLTLERLDGTTLFYVNDALQPGSSATGTVGTNMHLGVTPGGGSGFAGNLDELTVTVVPEPTALGVLALGGLGLLARRRRNA